MECPSFELCDGLLRRMLSFLDVEDVVCRAPLVSKRWHKAAHCRSTWLRRVHPHLLKTAQDDVLCGRKGLPIAQLYSMMYQSNMLRNPLFLESNNSVPKAHGKREHVWVATSYGRGNWPCMTWEHPMLDAGCQTAFKKRGLTSSFGVGCITMGDDWSELVQVVDIRQAMHQACLPEFVLQEALGMNIPLCLSVLVAGKKGLSSEFQIVVAAHSDAASPTADPARDDPALKAAISADMRAEGRPRYDGPQRRPQQCVHELDGSVAYVFGPHTTRSACWEEFRCVINTADWKRMPSRVTVMLRGRACSAQRDAVEQWRRSGNRVYHGPMRMPQRFNNYPYAAPTPPEDRNGEGGGTQCLCDATGMLAEGPCWLSLGDNSSRVRWHKEPEVCYGTESIPAPRQSMYRGARFTCARLSFLPRNEAAAMFGDAEDV